MSLHTLEANSEASTYFPPRPAIPAVVKGMIAARKMFLKQKLEVNEHGLYTKFDFRPVAIL